jgi:hypothetical protein
MSRTNEPWHGPRSVAFWTIVGSTAGVLSLIVAIVAFGGSGTNHANIATTPSPDPGLTGSTSVPPADNSSIATQLSDTPTRVSQTYLADLDPIEGLYSDLSWTKRGGVEISGRSYPHSVQPICPGHTQRLEYNVAKKYSQFSAELGIGDDADSNAIADVTIYGDERVLKAATVQVGKSIALKLDIHNVLRLAIQCEPRSVHPDRGIPAFSAALGDALIG